MSGHSLHLFDHGSRCRGVIGPQEDVATAHVNTIVRRRTAQILRIFLRSNQDGGDLLCIGLNLGAKFQGFVQDSQRLLSVNAAEADPICLERGGDVEKRRWRARG